MQNGWLVLSYNQVGMRFELPKAHYKMNKRFRVYRMHNFGSLLPKYSKKSCMDIEIGYRVSLKAAISSKFLD
jgi:hypothetical protein